jgi:lysocardiolipin and lysophospholipid acyltransferase
VILITVLFAPTSIVITVSSPSSSEPATLNFERLVERDAKGNVERINLPDRLVIMANHQAYTDWMYTWILSAYAGHQRGLVILLKKQLKNIPIVGWGMVRVVPTARADRQQFFRFIFLSRSWASDRTNLTLALTELGQKTKTSNDSSVGSETQPLLKEDGQVATAASGSSQTMSKRNPLWLLIFPEGTITSDDERVKSKRYADKEGIVR